MTRIISLANQKGGVGKTTTTISLGAALAELGQRVLLVDFDPQGALSVGVGVNSIELDQTIYNLILDRATRFEDVVIKTNIMGVDLLPGNIDLSAAEVVLVSEVAREQALKRVLHAAQDEYDYILIDCPPSLGLLTVNALAAANRLIVPVQCEYYALEGLTRLMETIAGVRGRLNPGLRVAGMLLTMHDARTRVSGDVVAEVRKHFPELAFRTVVPRNVRLAEAPSYGEPVIRYDPHCAGADAYFEAAKEVAERG